MVSLRYFEVYISGDHRRYYFLHFNTHTIMNLRFNVVCEVETKEKMCLVTETVTITNPVKRTLTGMLRLIAGEVMLNVKENKKLLSIQGVMQHVFYTLTEMRGNTLKTGTVKSIISLLNWRIAHCEKIRSDLEREGVVRKYQDLTEDERSEYWSLIDPEKPHINYNHSTMVSMIWMRDQLLYSLVEISSFD